MGSRAPRHRAQRGSSGLPNALQAVGVAGGALAAVAVLTVVAGGSSRIQGPTVGDPTSASTSPARPFTSSGSGGSTPTPRVVPVRSLPPQAPVTTAPPPFAPAARPTSVPPTEFTRTSTSPPAPTPAPTATTTPRPATTTPTPTPTPKVRPTRPVTPGIPPTSSPSPSPTG